jgi:hypothetical protein
VQDGEVSVDLGSILDEMVLLCKSTEDAKRLYNELDAHFQNGHAVCLMDVLKTNYLQEEMIDTLKSEYTFDEFYLYGFFPGKLSYHDGANFVLVGQPDEISGTSTSPGSSASIPEELKKEKERYSKTDTCCTSIMDTYQKWNKNADVLRFTTEELQVLAPRTKRNVHAVLADLYEKLDDDYFVSVATLMQVIWDIEKNNFQYDISFKDRFPLMTKNYDEDTLINYGWEDDDDAFCSDVTPDSDFYVIIKQPPHNITSLVEEWTKENRKEFEEETKAD